MRAEYQKKTLEYFRETVSSLLVFMSFWSCATMVSYEKSSESLHRSISCCETIAQFSYGSLTEAGEASFKLDESSDAFNFPSGKSYFRAFHLPQKRLPYFIKVASYALGETINKAHIFFPQVVLLDERFNVVQQSAPGDFRLSKIGYKEAASETGGLPIKLEGSLLVNNPRAKYVLIFTTQELMSSWSPYVANQVVPIILPKVVTTIPVGKRSVKIRHSPFGLLHIKIASPQTKVCPQGTEAEIEPKNAIADRFTGRDARRFTEAIEPGIDTSRLDTVIILQGAEVLGGTVAIGLMNGCILGSKFLSGLEYIYATQMLKLYRTNPDLQNSERIETETLQIVANAGEPAAQFLIGLNYAWGRGVAPDRMASIEWLKRGAQSGYSPAMIALGMALSGPGMILDEAEMVGKPLRTDKFTDLVMAYYWLDTASRTGEHSIKAEASFQLRELARRMSPEELRKGKAQVQKNKVGPD